jgi:uncharacterized protein (TIGR03067 family)
MIRAELAGEIAPELVATNTVVAFTAGVYQVRFDGQETDRGTYEVGAIAGTRTLMLRGVAGSNAGRAIPGIFQLTGDRLRVCYGLDGVLPVAFTTQPEQQRYLATYRRMP